MVKTTATTFSVSASAYDEFRHEGLGTAADQPKGSAASPNCREEAFPHVRQSSYERLLVDIPDRRHLGFNPLAATEQVVYIASTLSFGVLAGWNSLRRSS